MTFTARMPRSPILVLVLLALTPTACRHTPLSEARVRELAKIEYPADATDAGTLDIDVLTRGDRIVVVNRTPRRYENVRLWLDGRYVRSVTRIDIGSDNAWPLNTFINRYREPYPTGTLLRPEARQPPTMAQLHDPASGALHALTVVPEQE